MRISVFGEAEVGTKEFQFWKIKVRLGWYGRLSITGAANAQYSKCKPNQRGKNCIIVSGELGLIGSAKGWRIEGGIRGGVNISGSFCIVCNEQGCYPQFNLCGSLRGRLWGKVQVFWGWKAEYLKEIHEVV